MKFNLDEEITKLEERLARCDAKKAELDEDWYIDFDAMERVERVRTRAYAEFGKAVYANLEGV